MHMDTNKIHECIIHPVWGAYVYIYNWASFQPVLRIYDIPNSTFESDEDDDDDDEDEEEDDEDEEEEDEPEEKAKETEEKKSEWSDIYDVLLGLDMDPYNTKIHVVHKIKQSTTHHFIW